MRWLIDTNLLLARLRAGARSPLPSELALRTLLLRGDEIFYTPQVGREFYRSAVSRSDENAYALTPFQASQEWAEATGQFALLDDEPGIFAIWQDLVARYNLRGTRVFDANLVAAALHHRLDGLLTGDRKDLGVFRAEGLRILNPAESASG